MMGIYGGTYSIDRLVIAGIVKALVINNFAGNGDTSLTALTKGLNTQGPQGGVTSPNAGIFARERHGDRVSNSQMRGKKRERGETDQHQRRDELECPGLRART
jgi:hypothetical protein